MRGLPITLLALWLVALVFISIRFLNSQSIQPALTSRAAAISTSPESNPLERLVNDRRHMHNLPALKSNAALRESACAKAGDMNQKDYFDHVAPDGTQPWENFEDAGYEYTSAGENLARNFNEDAELVQAWMDSTTHRENVLGEYSEQGICTAGAYTVQHLGARG